MTFANLLVCEMRRALHRRLVWVLIAISFVGIGMLGVIAFFDSAGKSAAELTLEGTHPAVMIGWWVAGGGDGILLIGALPLFIGGLLGGASVAGAEWRAGTVTTLLTWEPRRVRVHLARAVSSFILATLIAVVLQVLFLAAALPAVFAHGTTAGIDGDWWAGLAGAVLRIAVLTGATAVLGNTLATLGRSTGFAFGVAFAWIAVAEQLIRGLKPSVLNWLLAENIITFMTWAPMEGVKGAPSVGASAVTLVAYFAALAALATLAFTRRDVSAAT